jgi:hypothetical protein
MAIVDGRFTSLLATFLSIVLFLIYIVTKTTLIFNMFFLLTGGEMFDTMDVLETLSHANLKSNEML